MEAMQTVKVYYGLSALNSFSISFVVATYVMFLRAHHLGYLECNLVNLTFFLTIFIFEVPTGAIADVYGRKVSYVISCLMMGVSMIAYAMSTTMPGFILAEVVGAIAVTFCSGAFEAWAVDRLKEQNSDIPLSQLMTRSSQVERLSSILGAALGSWLSGQNQTWPWLIAGALQFLTALAAAVLMKETRKARATKDWKNAYGEMKRTVKKSLELSRDKPALRFVLISGVLTCLTLQAPNMQWQPYFAKLFQNETGLLGLIFSGVMLAVAVGSQLSNSWKNTWKSEQRAMTAALVLTGLGICLTMLVQNPWLALTIFFIHEIGRGLYFTVQDVYIHENISSEERATMVSLNSMARQGGVSIGLVASGLLAEHYSSSLSWILSGLTLMVSALWLGYNKQPRQD